MEKLIKPSEALERIKKNAKEKLEKELKGFRLTFNTVVGLTTNSPITIKFDQDQFNSAVVFKDELEEMGYRVKIETSSGARPHTLIVELE